MKLDNNTIYQMLTSSPEEAEMAMIIIKNNKQDLPKNIIKIYNFYKLLRQQSYETWSYKNGKEIHNYPLSLIIPNFLNLERSHITCNDLPDDLYVNYDLNLSFNKGLRKLPNNLTVKGTLNISYTNIKEIPKNLNIFNLQFISTPLQKRYDEKKMDDLLTEIREKGGTIHNK